MDPDMVRQQEEAEAASLLGKTPAARAAIAPRILQNEPIMLRGEARGGGAEILVPAGPVRVGWGAAFAASFFCLLMSVAGLVAGIMIGVKFGLVPAQNFAIGVGLGYLLGWQAAATSLRKRSELRLGKAYAASFLPAAIMIITLVAGMFAAFHVTGISPDSIADGDLTHFWLIVGGSGLIGFLIAAIRIRRPFRKA